jgi:Tol biopolymer transport system component
MAPWRLLALIISVAVVTPPAFAAGDRRVVYTASTTGATLTTVNPDGTDTRVLTPGAQPVWSSNGRWIAYTDAYTQIWRVRGDGTGRHVMVRHRDKQLTEPTWSPTGRRVAYTASWVTGSEDEVGHVATYIANRDGSHRRILRRDARAPAWSPTGRRIALQAGRWIVTLKPNGRGFTRVHRSPEDFDGTPPVFSPSGAWLLYLTWTPESEAASPTRMNVLNMRTGALRQLPLDVTPGWPSDVTWTPDGRIAFLHHEWTRDGGLTPLTSVQLRTVRRDGTHQRTLATLTEWALPGAGLSWRSTG